MALAPTPRSNAGPRVLLGLGALLGLGSVGMAAYAAHGLEAIGAARLAMVRSAVEMGGWHALALLFCGLWAERRGGRAPVAAGAAFAVGALLFCGGVYGLALGGWAVGGVAPVGGTLLMLGWLLVGVGALRRGPGGA